MVLLEQIPLPFNSIIEHGKRYLVPRSDGKILIGSTEERVGFQKNNTAEAIAELLRFGVGLVPALRSARFIQAWSGLRPYRAGELPCLSFGGLSKVHRACGYRIGWMSLSGAPAHSAAYRDALQLLAALRLCANVTAQWAVLPALQDAPTIGSLTAPGGRLHEARHAVLHGVATSEYLDLVTPQGALYAFPQVRAEYIPHFDDESFALRLLEEESVLVVPGSSFNVPRSRHFRLTLLPPPAQLREVFVRIERVLARMAREQHRVMAA